MTTGGGIVSIVWDDATVENIVMSEGFSEKLGMGGIHILMSRVSSVTLRRLAALYTEHGNAYVEAPIFGRSEVAIAKKL
ncbi:hypothetical protein GMB86_09180 [Terrilactibacillus sp. BCM23-1]|uniref:6-phosphogluconate dehydrogenase NADP-binding domain-containing protein n=1 Tax=Terrilactibacillus tamarindi TaxID=2599694 RepID=A0A6N8CVA1_9BACI|nr:NAD(P)-binding domain-containing protein [Terrilactibacillus tamarindi]MTT32176.1 hypothetical protein [Terrilactibacillus tamarindi]